MQCGGGPGTPAMQAAAKFENDLRDMGVAPGGLIRQCIVKDPYKSTDWDNENTALFQ